MWLQFIELCSAIDHAFCNRFMSYSRVVFLVPLLVICIAQRAREAGCVPTRLFIFSRLRCEFDLAPADIKESLRTHEPIGFVNACPEIQAHYDWNLPVLENRVVNVGHIPAIRPA